MAGAMLQGLYRPQVTQNNMLCVRSIFFRKGNRKAQKQNTQNNVEKHRMHKNQFRLHFTG